MIKDIISELNAAAASVTASIKDLDCKRDALKSAQSGVESAKANTQAALAKHDAAAVALASGALAVAGQIESEAKAALVTAEAALKSVVTSAVEVSNRLQGELVVAARAKAEALLSDLFADRHQNMVKHQAGMTKIATESASLPSLFLNGRNPGLIEGVARNFAVTSASLIEFAAKLS
jgi:hypothetical protein